MKLNDLTILDSANLLNTFRVAIGTRHRHMTNGTNTLSGVFVSVPGTNDALQQSVAKAKNTTHANWGCLTRPFISILSVHLRQE